jgi:hypothetical protein
MFTEFSQYMRLFEGIACNIPIASDCFTTIISTAEEVVRSGLMEIQEHHNEYCCKLPHRLESLLKYLNINYMLEVLPDQPRT